MKKPWIVLVCALLLTTSTGFFSTNHASAMDKDAQIEMLMKKLEDSEKQRDAELSVLKQRIQALEKNQKTGQTARRQGSSANVDDLRVSVGELQKKLDAQNSALTTFAQAWGDRKFKVGFRTQAWYQFVEDAKDGGDDDLNDFMVRRAYLYLKGQVTEKVGFFGHIAADRVGQDGLDNSAMGLGTGIAVRDAWILYDHSDAFKIQAGRMYVPFTRNYGTTSTFGQLTLDLTYAQGGGGIFYASKVGRDDGVVFWGNPMDGKIQYRLGIMEGVEGTGNEDDRLRYVGRVALNLLEPETSWFNKGTYLGEKKVLALGFGFDHQDDLQLAGATDKRSLAWTADVFYDHPFGEGAITAEAAYIRLKNATQDLKFSWLSAGEDAELYYIQGGYLLPGTIGPGRVQPYFRWERLSVEHDSDTIIPAAGINYYWKGHSAKLSLDWTMLDQRGDNLATFGGSSPSSRYTGKDQHIVTFQASVGF
jgi:hypothetical protein